MVKAKANIKSFYIEIVSCCNQRCIYCYNENIIAHHDILPVSIIEKLVQDGKKLGAGSCTLSGGEPLLHPDFADILRIAHIADIKTTVITNLTRLTEKHAELLSKYHPGIQITLDGGCEEIHDISRGTGTFLKQQEGLDLLKKEGYSGSIELRCNLWKGNCTEDNILSILEYARRKEIKRIKFALAHPTEVFKDCIEDEGVKAQISLWIKRQMKNYPDIRFSFPEGEAEFGCPFLDNREHVDCGFRIAPNGDVFPCQLFSQEEYSIGNLYRKSIEQIVSGEKLEHFLILMRIRKDFIAECQKCVCQSMCKGGCPAKALLTTGNILKPSGPCRKRKSVYREILGRILAENA